MLSLCLLSSQGFGAVTSFTVVFIGKPGVLFAWCPGNVPDEKVQNDNYDR